MSTLCQSGGLHDTSIGGAAGIPMFSFCRSGMKKETVVEGLLLQRGRVVVGDLFRRAADESCDRRLWEVW